jgi:hypothetical protein
MSVTNSRRFILSNCVKSLRLRPGRSISNWQRSVSRELSVGSAVLQ